MSDPKRTPELEKQIMEALACAVADDIDLAMVTPCTNCGEIGYGHIGEEPPRDADGVACPGWEPDPFYQHAADKGWHQATYDGEPWGCHGCRGKVRGAGPWSHPDWDYQFCTPCCWKHLGWKQDVAETITVPEDLQPRKVDVLPMDTPKTIAQKINAVNVDKPLKHDPELVARIKKYRDEKNMTYRQIARKLGMSKELVACIYKGRDWKIRAAMEADAIAVEHREADRKRAEQLAAQDQHSPPNE